MLDVELLETGFELAELLTTLEITLDFELEAGVLELTRLELTRLELTALDFELAIEELLTDELLPIGP